MCESENTRYEQEGMQKACASFPSSIFHIPSHDIPPSCHAQSRQSLEAKSKGPKWLKHFLNPEPGLQFLAMLRDVACMKRDALKASKRPSHTHTHTRTYTRRCSGFCKHRRDAFGHEMFCNVMVEGK